MKEIFNTDKRFGFGESTEGYARRYYPDLSWSHYVNLRPILFYKQGWKHIYYATKIKTRQSNKSKEKFS